MPLITSYLEVEVMVDQILHLASFLRASKGKSISVKGSQSVEFDVPK